MPGYFRQRLASPKQTVGPVKQYAERSHVCVFVSAKENKRVYMVAVKKALRINRKQVGSRGFAKAFIHNIQVDSSGINFLQVLIRHDISVSFREKNVNKFLIDVPYGRQDRRPIFSIYPLSADNGIRSI